MWLESLGPAGHLVRSGSVNDSLEIQSPAATPNTLRRDFSQTSQPVCVTKKQTDVYTAFT